MTDSVVRAAVAALRTGPRHGVLDALPVVPSRPGLYAIYGDDVAIESLGIGRTDAPLYVGKAERSLVGRDLGPTSPRARPAPPPCGEPLPLSCATNSVSGRSHATLLALTAARTTRSSQPVSQRLTDWMAAHLRLAVWPSPEDVGLEGWSRLF
jgi:hypothetical protein